jgi:DNA processing protein
MRENIKYWVSSNMIKNVGPIKLRKLLEEHGSIAAVCEKMNAPLDEAEKIIQQCQEKNISIIPLDSDDYPSLLKNIYDPPPVLYVRGKLPGPKDKTIAIVGTRKASHYGKETARKLGQELASLGFTIVSGMALGIDTEAHEGALEASGRTVAVLGCGVDIVYPPRNRELMSSILSSGAVVSEFPPESGPENWKFPQRNRIISGLSMGVIVVEGHYDSGAMITAKLALDQGREVFAVPGNVELDQSKGPHWLIKQGAKLIESVEDVLDEFNMVMPGEMPNAELRMTNEGRDYTELSDEEQKIVAVLSLEPKHIDNISIETGISVHKISSLLMLLEIKKVLRQLPGKMFVKTR